MTDWLSVNDRLPEPGQKVLRLGVDMFGNIRVDREVIISTDGYRWSDWGVMYWLPIPELPAEVTEKAETRKAVLSD